jgi:hypothetical protein
MGKFVLPHVALWVVFLVRFASGQVAFNELKIRHFVAADNGDTLCLAISEENPAVKLARTAFFFERVAGNDSMILQTGFEDSYLIEYAIDDFDGDGNNDVMIIAEDEASYNFTIFRTQRANKHFRVVEAYMSAGFLLSQTDIPGSTRGIYRIQKRHGVVERIIFYAGISDGYSSFFVRFMKAKKRFEASPNAKLLAE